MGQLKSRSLTFWLSSLLAVSAAGASKPERLLLKFYAKADPKVSPVYLREVVRTSEKWLKRASLLNQEDTFLSMGHRESEFNMFADDVALTNKDNHSIGVYQTQEKLMPELRYWWHLRGYELGPNDSLDTQCAFGVAEFRIHLNRADGNVYGGVRRYNGAGRNAHKYARNVFISRRVIFGRPHEDGEAVKVDKIKTKIQPNRRFKYAKP